VADQKLRTLVVDVKAKLDELKAIGPEGEKAAAKLAKGMASAHAPTEKLGALQGALKSQLEAVVPGASRLEGALARVGLTAEAAGGSLATGLALGAVGAGVALVGLGIKAVGMYTELVGKVDQFQDVTGASAETSSRLVAVFEQYGISGDRASAAMFKLSKATETNEVGLGKLGIQVAHNADGTADLEGTLFNVVGAYGATNDAAVKNQIAFTAFGKSGADLIDVLEVDSGRLRQLAGDVQNVVTQEDIDRVKEFNRQQQETGQHAEHLGEVIGQKLLPVWGGLLDIVDRGIVAFTSTENLVDYEKRQRAVESSTTALKNALADQNDELEQNAQLTQAAADRILGLVDNQLRVRESTASVARAQTDYNDAVKKNGPASAEAQAAQLSLERAVLSQAQAMIAGAKADADAAVAKQGLASGAGSAAAKIAAERASLEALIPTLAPGSTLRTYMEQYLATLDRVPGSLTTTLHVRLSDETGGQLTSSGTQIFGGGRAAGGPVVPNTVYRVGEHGPEWLVMGASGGLVIPAGGGGPVEVSNMASTRRLESLIAAQNDLLAMAIASPGTPAFGTRAYG
jgi:hypothetical protein